MNTNIEVKLFYYFWNSHFNWELRFFVYYTVQAMLTRDLNCRNNMKVELFPWLVPMHIKDKKVILHGETFLQYSIHINLIVGFFCFDYRILG